MSVANRSVHPAHAFLLASAVPLFIGAALSDYAFKTTSEVQWINFADWLIVGGLVFTAAALVCGIFGLRRSRHLLVGFLLVLATFVLGVADALIHARDAWATMPVGFVLSVLVALLACAAAWVGFRSLRTDATP